MGLHVMDGHEWLPQTESGGLRPADAYQERPDEARPRGDSHGVHIAQLATRLLQRPVHYIVDTLYVGSRRNLRNDTAIEDVLVLGVDHMALEGVRGLQHRRGGLITTRLEAQDELAAHRATHRATGPLTGPSQFDPPANLDRVGSRHHEHEGGDAVHLDLDSAPLEFSEVLKRIGRHDGYQVVCDHR